MKKILLIITGSIAAYKSLDLIRLLRKSEYEVNCVMTKAAQEFITPLLVSAISNNKVYADLFSLKDESEMGHINLSRENDLIIVAPASADVIAKMANGIADDLASTILSATNKPVMIAPAMNEKMWNNAANKQNIDKLRENGIKILQPESDILACGEYGVGKMTDVDNIFSEVDNFFSKKKVFEGKKVIISAGATFEPIDSVRFIGNYSSGKQGVAIAENFADLGADVTLVAANVSLDINLPEKNIIRVKTAAEMLKNIENNINKTDIFISVAAVSDFKPKKFINRKIKKSSDELTSLELVENIDILKTISYSKNRPKVVVGFAAESEDLIKNAGEKLQNKKCDLIIANNIDNGAVFGQNRNQVSLLFKDGKVKKLPEMSKKEVAENIVNVIAELSC